MKEYARISVYRKRHEDLVHFFKMLSLILMAWYSILITILWTGDSLETHLSSVSKQFSFTVATPYLPFLLVKQSWENMKILMEAINCYKFKLQICGDLRVIALLLGLQQGFTKYCCFISEWDSRARSLHYKRKDWPARRSLEPGIMNVENQPLVEPVKFCCHPCILSLVWWNILWRPRTKKKLPLLTYEKGSPD